MRESKKKIEEFFFSLSYKPSNRFLCSLVVSLFSLSFFGAMEAPNPLPPLPWASAPKAAAPELISVGAKIEVKLEKRKSENSIPPDSSKQTFFRPHSTRPPPLLHLDLFSSTRPPPSPLSTSSPLLSRQVLWQLVDDGDNEAPVGEGRAEEEAASSAATAATDAAAAAPEEQGTAAATTTSAMAAAAAATAAATTAEAAKKEPQVVWWAATVESLRGEPGGPLRAMLRYEAKPELGFDSETALVEFPPPAPSSSPGRGAPRELRNVGEDGALSDEVALPWRLLGEADEEGDEEGEEGEEEEEEPGMEEEDAVPFATDEISASDLEKTLSAQLSSLERATGLTADAAGAAALLAGAGGSSARAAEVALQFEAFGEILKSKLAAAARANGGAALGAEEVRAAVAEARRSGGNAGGGGSGGA